MITVEVLLKYGASIIVQSSRHLELTIVI